MEVKNNISSLFWWDATNSPSYFNGYIVLPKNSKYYGKEYDAINKEIEIHKGFTFSNFVLNELKNAVDQIIQQELKYDVEKVIKKELSNIVEQIVAKELGNKIDKKSRERESE